MLSKEEINSMINQPAAIRFIYTVKRIADFSEVWVIKENEKITYQMRKLPDN